MTTIITSLYDIRSKENNDGPVRSITEYLERSKFVLSLDCPMVIFTEEKFRNHFETNRDMTKTLIIYEPIEQSWGYQYLDTLTELRDNYIINNMNPNKDTPLYITLTDNKFDYISQVVKKNPFETDHFLWLDLGITHVAQNPEIIHDWLDKIPDKIRLLEINPYIDNVEPKEYFKNIYHNVAAGLISGSGDNMLRFCDLFKKTFTDILSQGWYQLDEAIMAMIMRNHRDLFDPYYGDYMGIISNYNKYHIAEDIIRYAVEKCLRHRDYDKCKHILNYLSTNIPSECREEYGRYYTMIKQHDEDFPVPDSLSDIFDIDKVRTYRYSGRNREAYDLAIAMLKTDNSKQLNLIYDELSIVSYYVGDIETGRKACDYVLLSPHSNKKQVELVLKNHIFYMNRLPVIKTITIDYQLPFNYFSSSPCLIPIENGYRYNIRGLNYTINADGSYNIRDNYGIIRTRNFVLDLSKDFEIQRDYELIDKSGIKLQNYNIKGYEDLRLFDHNSNNYFFGTCLETNEHRLPQICFGQYDHNGNINRVFPLNIDEIRYEKNWLPFVNYENEINFIYSWDPFLVYHLDPTTSHINQIINKRFDQYNLTEFRGSAPPIPYKDGYLCTVHYVIYETPRKYFHRFIYLSNDFKEIKIGKAFYFREINIEFNLSICHSDDGLLITHSFRDGTAEISLVDYYF